MMGVVRYGAMRPGIWYGGHIFMGILCALLMIAFIVWIIRMVTWRRRGMACGMGYMHHMHGMYGEHGMAEPHDEALEILRKRFASGEISKEEYEERLNTLRGNAK